MSLSEWSQRQEFVCCWDQAAKMFASCSRCVTWLGGYGRNLKPPSWKSLELTWHEQHNLRQLLWNYSCNLNRSPKTNSVTATKSSNSVVKFILTNTKLLFQPEPFVFKPLTQCNSNRTEHFWPEKSANCEMTRLSRFLETPKDASVNKFIHRKLDWGCTIWQTCCSVLYLYVWKPVSPVLYHSKQLYTPGRTHIY